MISPLQFNDCSNNDYEQSLLTQIQKVANSLNGDELETFEERSAIMEYEGSLSREEADWRALRIILENRPKIAV